MSEFLHGVKTTEALAGVKPINAPPTAVVGLVGTAPTFLTGGNPDDKFSLVTSDRHAAAFGPDIPGFTIPNALNAILAYGSARVIVVNVFDPELHSASVTDEAVTLDDSGQAQLANMGIISAVVSYQGQSITEGADYKLDRATGVIKRVKDGAIPPKAALTVTYEYGDPSKVTNAKIIGAINDAGLRSGMQLFLESASTLGYKPRILIAPGFSTQKSVQDALDSLAHKLKGQTYFDVPVGTTIMQAIAGRGGEGGINLGTESARTVWCYPHVGVVSPRTGEVVLEPFSQHLAGLACSVDISSGFWVSPSNQPLRSIEKLETAVRWDPSDPNCEANLLNAVGIVTVVRPFGGSFRAWGNRSAAWPTETHPINFINVRVVADYLNEVVERAALSYIDKPLSRPTLNALAEDVLSEIKRLVASGALVGGDFTWPPEDNPVSELALGHATYQLTFMPPVPMEAVKIRSVIDTTWLNNLYQA